MKFITLSGIDINTRAIATIEHFFSDDKKSWVAITLVTGNRITRNFDSIESARDCYYSLLDDLEDEEE